MFINNKHNTNQLEHFIHAVRSDPENFGQKSFVVIGVHGWFPMKLVRSMVGEPTGTSARFCEMMVLSLKRYFETEHQLTIPDQCITVIPLEWEGKVEDRVENLYRILLENEAWVTALKAADMVLWATHSQGTPVSTMLLHKLIDAAYIQVPRQSVCLLAMAGISHGPFPYLKGSIIVKYFEADAARELFDFMDSNSDISTKFRMSMAYILRQNVKTVLVGSMQDQVVPLYSAIMSGTSHPNILRAIYIDGHIFSENDFLINLITLALRLRNAGFSDHGLLTHISEVLAGNLYSWEGGHSTIYDELGVYTIAIRYLFETQPLGKRKLMEPRSPASTVAAGAAVASSNHVTPRTTKVAAVEPKLDQFNAKVRLNPFYLPWAMRGIYDDARVQGDEFFHRELLRLQDLFDRWQPSSSKLKEIKFRLEPLKARL
ncbi:uncharacterized protein BYT42DRAFT_499293 [Radiomyces spectabilis]|uniref:uncharacterized protein n=1 Tax=Radiomyces spectabilis TaxID=64574 RepID=UPI0022206120|nr:uncharacterized protein BYT42DRAFT_499293 [Radiomyces spectabilis]KAI8374370.1 hypothetical protein BYT42DRAFT_499293 [Radiomyces spectabilis]